MPDFITPLGFLIMFLICTVANQMFKTRRFRRSGLMRPVLWTCVWWIGMVLHGTRTTLRFFGECLSERAPSR